MTKISRAISIRQPYLELILRGNKTEDYRSRKTLIRERVYLYAAAKPGAPESWEEVGKVPGSLPVGLIVGSIEVTDCKQLRNGDYAYTLRRPKRLRKKLIPLNQPQPGFWIPQF